MNGLVLRGLAAVSIWTILFPVSGEYALGAGVGGFIGAFRVSRRSACSCALARAAAATAGLPDFSGFVLFFLFWATSVFHCWLVEWCRQTAHTILPRNPRAILKPRPQLGTFRKNQR